MKRFLQTTWRMVYFWKLLLAAVPLLFTIFVLRLEPDDFDLVFSPAIKAPFFALSSASTLFIGMIPKNPGPNDVVIDVFIRIVGALTACLAGWYWLLGETSGDPSGYLLLLVPVFTFIVGVTIVGPFLTYLATFSLRESPSEDKGNHE